jgi:hypothetical protein
MRDRPQLRSVLFVGQCTAAKKALYEINERLQDDRRTILFIQLHNTIEGFCRRIALVECKPVIAATFGITVLATNLPDLIEQRFSRRTKHALKVRVTNRSCDARLVAMRRFFGRPKEFIDGHLMDRSLATT